MRPEKKLSGTCTHCGMPLEFPAESIGLEAQCPFCRKRTELRLGVPATEPGIPRRAIALIAITLVILGLGIGGIFFALHRARSLVDRPSAEQPTVTNRVSR